MRLQGLRRGDVVEIEGDPVSLWIVTDPMPRTKHLRIKLRRGGGERTVSSYEVVGWWRKVTIRPRRASSQSA